MTQTKHLKHFEKLNAALPYALPEELWYIHDLDLPMDAQIVMIGAGPGLFAMARMEDRYDKSRIFIIDCDEGVFKYTEAHLGMAQVDASRYTLIHGDSAVVGLDWRGKIDLLIVDGDHSYGGVKKDILAWTPHVKQGGFVFFHDVKERPSGFNGVGEWEYGETKEAIEECLYSFTLFGEIGISEIYQKV